MVLGSRLSHWLRRYRHFWCKTCWDLGAFRICWPWFGQDPWGMVRAPHVCVNTHTHTYIYVYIHTHTRTYIDTRRSISIYYMCHVYVCAQWADLSSLRAPASKATLARRPKRVWAFGAWGSGILGSSLTLRVRVPKYDASTQLHRIALPNQEAI